MSEGLLPDELPEIRYVDAGGTSIAYQVFGEGPDLVVVPGLLGHLEAIWDIPGMARAYREVARTCRVVLFDKRGTGLSDRLPRDREIRLEERARDIGAVMDALGIERSAVMAQADGVAVACLFAATNPERLSHLVLISGSARMLADEDYPCGLPAEDVEAALASLERDWGDSSAPAGIDLLTPSRAHDPAWRRTLARIQRLSCPPAAARAHWESAVLVDVRGILAAVQTRTLLVHSRYDRLFPFEQGRWLAGHLPDARLLELDHLDHLFPGAAAPEVVEFITGERPHVSADNALVTVLFTDIVGSTRSAAAAGDEEWRLTLDRHDAMTRRQIVRHGGREIKSTGDGFLATFTGPAGAIEAACAIRDGATALGIDLRAGLHTGIVELRAEDLAGTAVNLAARVMACAGPCEVMVSRTVVDLLAGSNFVFADRGSRELKGLSGSWQLFAVE